MSLGALYILGILLSKVKHGTLFCKRATSVLFSPPQDIHEVFALWKKGEKYKNSGYPIKERTTAQLTTGLHTTSQHQAATALNLLSLGICSYPGVFVHPSARCDLQLLSSFTLHHFGLQKVSQKCLYFSDSGENFHASMKLPNKWNHWWCCDHDVSFISVKLLETDFRNFNKASSYAL